ncbi:UNVERIFIED_CONTAM: ATP-binding cassette subfamily B protein [Paenibacillus sp. PvR008]
MRNRLLNHIKNVTLIIKFFSTKDLIMSLLLMLLSALVAPLSTWLYKLLIDNLSFIKSAASLNQKFLLIIIGYAALNIILECLEIANGHINIRLKYNINHEFTKKVNKKISKISMEQLDDPSIYDLLDRIQSNVNTGLLSYVNNTLSVVLPVFSIFTYIILLMNLNLFFPLIAILATIPYLLLMIKHGKNSYFQTVQQSKALRKLNYMYEVLTTRGYAKEIRIFNLINYFNDRTEKVRKQLWNEKYSLLLKYTLGGAFVDLFRNIALGICLFITCIGVFKSKMSIGDVMLVISSMQAITSSLTSMVNKIGSMNRYSLYINDLIEFLNIREDPSNQQKKIKGVLTIEYKNVDFKYPNGRNNTLKNINIKISKGEKVALVGENGSGKTTFINILLGLYKPTAGEVYIGKQTLTEVIEDFRNITVCVFQNFIKYQLSVEDNIKAGNFGEAFKESSLRIFDMNTFIKNLPQGKQTQLGQLENNNTELSGGQWQRLAIARALSRERAEVLIMDEPTASLDPKVETQLYEEFSLFCENKTTILISHRLGVTKLCDKIYVFDKGEICEYGSHFELMSLKGKYYSMYTAQCGLYV